MGLGMLLHDDTLAVCADDVGADGDRARLQVDGVPLQAARLPHPASRAGEELDHIEEVEALQVFVHPHPVKQDR